MVSEKLVEVWYRKPQIEPNSPGEIRCQFIFGEIRCQFIILGKSGVSSSFWEIRCQFIILASKEELTPDFPVSLGSHPMKANYRLDARGNPVSVHHSGKSGVSSSFLPEKTNRHRISLSVLEVFP